LCCWRSVGPHDVAAGASVLGRLGPQLRPDAVVERVDQDAESDQEREERENLATMVAHPHVERAVVPADMRPPRANVAREGPDDRNREHGCKCNRVAGPTEPTSERYHERRDDGEQNEEQNHWWVSFGKACRRNDVKSLLLLFTAGSIA